MSEVVYELILDEIDEETLKELEKLLEDQDEYYNVPQCFTMQTRYSGINIYAESLFQFYIREPEVPDPNPGGPATM